MTERRSADASGGRTIDLLYFLYLSRLHRVNDYPIAWEDDQAGEIAHLFRDVPFPWVWW